MKTKITVIAVTILIATATMFVCSTVWAADSRQVWLGNSLVLRVRSDAGGYTVAQRVNALQLRSNLLLQDGNDLPKFTVRKSGTDSNIYADNAFFMTVTSADGQANGTTSAKLARNWAGRLGAILPGVTMYKPGVGRPGQLGASGNARYPHTETAN
ncbi:MAG: hypothetical protein Q7T82_11945 [Armatimonadota bacterium]|nr:hypothetical protein [Armatimonadota bacterium]